MTRITPQGVINDDELDNSGDPQSPKTNPLPNTTFSKAAETAFRIAERVFQMMGVETSNVRMLAFFSQLSGPLRVSNLVVRVVQRTKGGYSTVYSFTV